MIDPRTIAPLDDATIIESVAKTGRLVVADPAWKSFGVSGEIVARVTEKGHHLLKAPVSRVTFPDTHSPTSSALEGEFFPDENDVAKAARALVGQTVS